MAGPGEVQTVERAFAVLELVADAPNGRSVSELAAMTGVTPSTIHRTLKTLRTLGYLRQDGAKRYLLGVPLRHLGARVQDQLGAFVRPLLEEIASEVGELTNFAVLDGTMVAFLEHISPPALRGLRVDSGDIGYAHATGVGKAILAQMSDSEVASFVRRAGLPAVAEATITDADRLQQELRTIRTRGYALDEGESAAGVVCCAVALPTSHVRAAVSVSGPDIRMTPAVVRSAIQLLRERAPDLAVALEARDA